mmetsp:Transcript_11123/g.16691  ORF Transcript_11123/g.16691 Transcript_11123/m.16691 type:complete len:115 (+) Transcript_11123:92-436(+)
MTAIAFTRGQVLQLYKKILRAGQAMPTENRVLYIRDKARHDFRKYQNETCIETVNFQLKLAETHLDSIEWHAKHLDYVFSGALAKQAAKDNQAVPKELQTDPFMDQSSNNKQEN